MLIYRAKAWQDKLYRLAAAVPTFYWHQLILQIAFLSDVFFHCNKVIVDEVGAEKMERKVSYISLVYYNFRASPKRVKNVNVYPTDYSLVQIFDKFGEQIRQSFYPISKRHILSKFLKWPTTSHSCVTPSSYLINIAARQRQPEINIIIL